jgi:glycosyltransferase involved in cell wall biosynthesis
MHETATNTNGNGAAPPSRPTEVRPKRIVLVAGRLEPTAPCRAVVGLARHLIRLGHPVLLACRGGSIDHVFPGLVRRPAEAEPGVLLSRAVRSSWGFGHSLRRLASLIADFEPDLLHVHGADLDHVAARLARRLGCSYVLSIGDFVDPGHSVSVSRRHVRRIVVPSDALRVDLVNRMRLPRSLIALVPEGIDLAAYPLHGAASWQGRAPVVGAVGRFIPSQGQEHFIQAAYLLAVRGRMGHFVVAGSGPDRKRLQNLVDELDLRDRVTFARTPIDQLSVLRALDILIAPAVREALGLTLIEAMASGVPVITTSAGGVYSLVENRKTGLVVPKRDADALAKQIEYLIDHPYLATSMAEKARQRVAERHSLEVVAPQMLAVYDGAVAEGQGG